jgi:signal transduction histidine kinase
MSVLQTALFLQQRGQPIQWVPLATSRLIDWYTCFAFAPAYVWMIQRYLFDHGRRALALPLLLVATVVFVLIKYAALVPLARALGLAQPGTTFKGMLAANVFTEMLFLAGIALAIYAWELYRRVRQEQLERSRLGRELADARLDALTLQLQPHFLFNTLNSILALIRRDPRAAEDMLTELSELLQRTLRGAGHEVTLATELEHLELYLDIMRHRFGDGLSTHVDADADARHALVPRFLLQPIAENAIEHGFAEHGGAGRLSVVATVRNDRLRVAVEDNGSATPARRAPKPNGGIGLGNTRRRLEAMYGSAGQLSIEPNGSGTTVTVAIPYRRESTTI